MRGKNIYLRDCIVGGFGSDIDISSKCTQKPSGVVGIYMHKICVQMYVYMRALHYTCTCVSVHVMYMC